MTTLDIAGWCDNCGEERCCCPPELRNQKDYAHSGGDCDPAVPFCGATPGKRPSRSEKEHPMNEFVDLLPVVSALLMLAALLLLGIVAVDRLRHRAPEPDEDTEDDNEQEEEGASGEWAAILHQISEELHTVPAPPTVGQYALESWWQAPAYAEAPQTFYDETAAVCPVSDFDEELLSFTASWSRDYIDGILAGGAR